MEIRCACGNVFFTKAVKLTGFRNNYMSDNLVEVEEETYYTCRTCGFTVAKKDVNNFPITKDGKRDVIVLFREFD